MTEESLPPLTERLSALRWLRQNLFSSWGNSLLTVLAAWLLWVSGKSLLIWTFVDARWQVVAANLRLLLIGQYPAEQAWRLWISMLLLIFLTGNSLGLWTKSRKFLAALAIFPLALALIPFEMEQRLWLLGLALAGALGWLAGHSAGARTSSRSGTSRAFENVVIVGWLIWIPIFILLLRGLTLEGEGWMPLVTTNLWGGLLLTFLLTIVAIVVSFPLGVLLALGRRSELPVVRWFSIGYIELVRGVPLIAVLFMAQLMLPLFLPAGVTVDRVLRAAVGITLFSAAYLAENVRGGLQAIPKGQFEAAYALGLGGFQTMLFIILPQALRLIIPILVGQFIALFKDTALVSIVGLFDLLGIAKTVLAQPEFLGYQREVYAFISLLYWVISYGMSYLSQQLEIALNVGKR
ncbi:MAG: amino acid ABC transporter permease [Anaerolineae bacterium CG_4_9_14_3_um_filter_57_17]|nr:amino acid ABC transporter permease [bacterium]NCT20515.1 amino acid ABC transporter permease [bacterium]OIO86367.1 MAG: amino acid ABC transporter permease [Anaerolineae bacterium CG2_30_57_67]PJB65708.1 MAG: amino acid ABC transporter permease [Anaerolineae bacterium CG_4_9_14_3_um_filter_57_17]